MAAEPVLLDSITGIWSYFGVIDWGEYWLWCLMGFHVWSAVFTLMAVTFSAYRCQVALFLLYLGLAYTSEYINEWAAKNYKLFSEQQYFDSNGLFISLLFSLPLLTNACVIVVYWMWDVIQTMITLKRSKVRHQQKQKTSEATNKQKENAPDSTSTDTSNEQEINNKDDPSKEISQDGEEENTTENQESTEDVEKTDQEKKED